PEPPVLTAQAAAPPAILHTGTTPVLAAEEIIGAGVTESSERIGRQIYLPLILLTSLLPIALWYFYLFGLI
ncbi:hypothetical protein ACTFGU_00850, partial [Campylobacter jejuni]